MPTRAKWAVGLAGGCFVLLGVLWFVAFHLGFVDGADDKVLFAFYDLSGLYHRHRIHTTANVFVAPFDPAHFVVLAVLPAVVALTRRRPYDACAALVLLGGACITTLALKHLLPEPRAASFLTSPVPYPRFPSGHSTGAMALVLALTLVAPARVRPLIAGLGAVFAAAVGYSLLTLGSHFPSDVFGGFIVASAWAFLTSGALLALDDRLGTLPMPSRAISLREALAPPLAALSAATALAAIVVLVDPQSAVSYVRAHTALVVGAFAIAALSTALATTVVLSVRRDVPG
jgi:membrane-associated phospholipid phosphatase